MSKIEQIKEPYVINIRNLGENEELHFHFNKFVHEKVEEKKRMSMHTQKRKEESKNPFRKFIRRANA